MSALSETLSARATELGFSQLDIANMLDMTAPAVSQLFNGRTAKPRKWREIAATLKIDEGAMLRLMQQAAAEALDASRGARLERSSQERDLLSSISKIIRDPPAAAIESPIAKASAELIPVMGEAGGGETERYTFGGQALEYLPCPPMLGGVRGAYATFVDGVLMFPRYKAGEIVWLNPNRPARRGDDVMVQVRPRRADLPNLGYLRQFVGWDGDTLTLTQYKGGEATTFQRSTVASIDVVVFASKY